MIKATGRRMALLALLVLGLAGCSAAASSGGGGDRDVILAEQIEGYGFTNALDVVRRLRPQWLRVRSAPSLQSAGPVEIVVYVDEIRYGDPSSLGNVTAPAIERIQWIDATTATQRWGTGHAGGVIAVTTRRGG